MWQLGDQMLAAGASDPLWLNSSLVSFAAGGSKWAVQELLDHGHRQLVRLLNAAVEEHAHLMGRYLILFACS